MRYLNSGKRRYDLYPVGNYSRQVWEFQAVISGEICPIYKRIRGQSASSHIWLHPPNSEHGWGAEKSDVVEVVVFHFYSVPALLNRILTSQNCLEKSLTKEEVKKVKDCYFRLLLHYKFPRQVSSLVEESVMLELSLMFLEESELEKNSPQQLIVDRAILWFEKNLSSGPRVEDVAKAISISVAHMRRLFHASLSLSPQKAFDNVRFAKICTLLEEGERSHEQIALECGFGSATAFSHAFKKRMKTSPKVWQKIHGIK